MVAWNYADLWEPIAEAIPERPAQIHGARTLSWRQFNRRADALARHFLDQGLANSPRWPPTFTTVPSTSRPTTPPSKPGWRL